jgi:hypothetical protein
MFAEVTQDEIALYLQYQVWLMHAWLWKWVCLFIEQSHSGNTFNLAATCAAIERKWWTAEQEQAMEATDRVHHSSGDCC